MAQSFDTARLRLKGEAFLVAPQIGTGGAGSIAVSNNGSLAYAREGIRGRLAQFAWFDRGGRHLSDVGPPGLYGEFSLSPDEKRLAVYISGSVWTLDLTRDGIFSRFTFEFSRHPIWSPDGARIIFTKSGSSALYEKPAGGTGAEQPLRGSVGIPTDWSRDARRKSAHPS